MSENITHTAVVDDCVRLMLTSDEICGAFKDAAMSHLDMTQLGCMTRAGDKCNPRLLASFRQQWEGRKPEDNLDAKLAFVIGWLCHRAADRQMKPVFRRFHPPETRTVSPTECSVYHDAFVFREVYAGGKEPPYHPTMFGEGFQALTSQANIDSFESLLQVLLRRVLIQMHTLIPDVDDPGGWIDRLFKLKQKFYVDLKRYDEAINHPDPEKLRCYIVEDNFYDRDEPIISVARHIHRGEEVSPAEVSEAVQAEAKSHYAIALKLGFGYLKAASDFFSSEMTVETLRMHLDIGKPGRDGAAV